MAITQAIGLEMPHGGAGTFARQPDSVIDTFAVGGSDPIPFGAALKLSSGKVVALGASGSPVDFIGVAGAEIKTALSLDAQGAGKYAAGDPIPVIRRGCVNVKCQKGTPAVGGAVYLRITANTSYEDAVVGGFEAEADSNKTIKLNGCEWAGAKDAAGVAELRLWGPVVYQAAAVADAASTPTKAEFNALTAALRAAGIIAPNA